MKTTPTPIPVKILLVDDDPRNLDVLESVLVFSDITLVRAMTAQDALLALVEGQFAAIVLDVQMPGTNGLELANLIKQRKRTKDVPIIFLTAFYVEDKDVLQGYQIGAVDYLTKPVNPQILKSKIHVFVELFRKNMELDRLNQTLKQAEEATRQAKNKLEVRVEERTAELVLANRAKDDFLAMLSHELRTPLGPALLLASDSANDPGLPEAVRQRFESIAKHVELEAKLIDDLLDLTRITNGKLLLEKKPVSVHSAIEEALVIVDPDIKGKQIATTTNLAAEYFTVRGDPVRLQQIFWNVIKNSVKFTPASGKITILSSSVDGKVSVKVTDSGIGMTSKEIDSVFKAFSQGEHADSERHRFGGLGLGLAITRQLVELQGGSIQAESAGRDQGSTFTIEFPLEESTPETYLPLATAGNADKSQAQRLSILLVEDDEPTQDTLLQLLSRRNHKVVAVGSLAEAREVSAKVKFDVVISDIGLPDGDGCALMAELRDKFGLQGIALTGYGMERDIGNAKKAGFITHLTKPVHIESLENALRHFH